MITIKYKIFQKVESSAIGPSLICIGHLHIQFIFYVFVVVYIVDMV